MTNPFSNAPHDGPTDSLPGREPLIWVRRLTVLKELRPDAVVVRDVSFRAGLNVICTKPTPKDTTKPRGHSVGKSLAVRLIRYCLGESSFFKHEDRLAIGGQLPNGYVVAEVRVKMESWVVARPIGFLSNAADSWASPCDSIKQFLDSLDSKGKFENFEACLDVATRECLAGLTLPNSGRQARWLDALGWISRDQQCRYRHHNEWRDPEAESGTGQLPKEDASLIIRMVMGLLDQKERELRTEHIALKEKRERRKTAKERLQTHLDFCEADLRRELNLSKNGLEGKAFAIHASDTAKAKKAGRETSYGEASAKLEKAINADAMIERNLNRQVAVLESQIETDEAEYKLKAAELKGHESASEAATDEEYEAAGKWCRFFVDDIRAKAQGCPMKGDPPLPGETDPARPGKIIRCKGELDAIQERKLARETKLGPIKSEHAETTTRLESNRAENTRAFQRHTKELGALDALIEKAADFEKRHGELKGEEEEHERIEAAITKSLKVQQAARNELEARLFKLSQAYETVLKRVMGAAASGAVEIDGNGIYPRPNKSLGSRGEAMGTFAMVLGFDFGCLLAGVLGLGSHPLLMIHDSPREADMEEPLYHALFHLVNEIEKRFPSDQVGFQYIVTTTTQPPGELNREPWVRLRLSSESNDGLFLGFQF